jgi:hypothetical protein
MNEAKPRESSFLPQKPKRWRRPQPQNAASKVVCNAL